MLRRNCSTCEQVTALTTLIENGFQRQLKTGAVFLNLTAAFDTVWHTGLLYKLSKNIPDWFVRLIELFLRDRHFKVHIGDDTSAWRTQVNGLPQGSVLSPTLFNLYTNDLLVTASRKFIYADDICLTKQAQRYAELECCLSSDMVRMASYCQLWRLKPCLMQIVTSVFHLLNTSATRELRVHMEGQQLRHDPNPVYLGMTLDRTELLATPYKDYWKVTKPE